MDKKDFGVAALVLLLLLLLSGGYYLNSQTKRNPYLAQGSLGMDSSEPTELVASSEDSMADPEAATKAQHHHYKKPLLVASNEPMTGPASVGGTSTLDTHGTPSKNIETALELDAGSHFLIPTLRFEFATSGGWTFGVQGSWEKNLSGDSVTSWGAGVIASYYFNRVAFQGFLVDASLGFYHIEGANIFRTSDATPVVFSSTFGWRGHLTPSFSFLASGGFEYAENFGKSTGDLYFHGLLPLVKVGFGYEF